MIGVAHEVGAQEVLFNHTVVHDDTQDLKLTPDQYLEMREIALLAERLADQYGIQNNLAFLRADVPTYLETEIAGSSVVPCYAGYYFAFVLGNGSVMFCCQCSESVDQIADGRRFRDIWNDHTYRRFRKAARALPQPDPLLHTCECDRCALRPRNVSIHNLVRPLSRIACGDEVKKFSIAVVGRKWHGMTI